MSHTSTNYQGSDHDGNTLGAGLLIAATATASGKYGRLWRRSIFVGIFITLKKSPYVPLPPSPSSEQLSRNFSARSYCTIDIPSDNNEDKVNRIVKEKDLNSLRNLGGVEQVASILGSHLETGIDRIQDQQGWNTNNPVHSKGFLYFFLQSCNSYTIFLLLISAGLSFSIEIIELGPQYGWHDGVAILVAVFLLVTLPSVANFRRAKNLEKNWRDKMTKLLVNVVRSGQTRSIAISDVMVGDIVLLKKGDTVPADGLFVNGNGLVLDEVLKFKIDGDRNPFLFSGSMVIEGEGRMIVTSVGANTALGQVLKSVTHDPAGKTLLEARIDKPHGYLDNLALFVSVLIASIILFRLIFRKQDKNDGELPELKGHVSVGLLMEIFKRILLKPQGKISILTSFLAAVMIAFQHGMPFIITLSLSFWKERFESEGASPQNLSACGSMGIVTVICVDATGGLMCKPIEVNKFCIGEKDLNDDVDSETNPFVLEALHRGIGVSVLLPEISVGTINDLLISWAKSRLRLGMNVEFLDQRFAILEHRKLSSNKKGIGVLMRNKGDDEKILHLHYKGAASTILDMCSHYYDSNGESHAMECEKRKFEQMVKDMEDSGLIAIGLACGQTDVREVREDRLHLLALVGLTYPFQNEIKLAVEALRSASRSVIMVSEDELSAVRAKACELGIFRPGLNDVALEGEEFRELTIPARRQKVDQITVMGSCLPEDKLLLVKCLQSEGHVVAFFGGLTSSDTPAIKQADVGITRDTQSTEMARESSDIVMSAKGSLLRLLKLGRCPYHNIQKFTQLQLTTCFSWLLIIVIETSRGKSPSTAIQLIWVNFIMCLLGGLMMVMELEIQELITHQQAERTQSLVTKDMRKNIVIQVFCQSIVLLIFEFAPGMNEDVRKSMIFNSFTLCQIFNQLNAMGLEKREVVVVVLGYYWFLVAVGAVMVMQVLVVEFAEGLAGGVRLNGIQWAICFLFAALSWGLDYAVKCFSD